MFRPLLASRLPLCPTARTVSFARSFFVSPVSPVAASENKAARKRAPKGKHAAPAKRVTPPKKPSQKPEKPRVRVPKSLKPPKRAPGPYFLFYSSFVKSQSQARSLVEFRELTKRAGEIWRGYSMPEKQPFYDENEVRKTQAKLDREEFFRSTSPSDLKKLNAIRKAQGKPRLHSTNRVPMPTSPFILFSKEFRNSPDAQILINETSPEKTYFVRVVVAAANRWKSMSSEEKAPYFERYRKAKEELKAEHIGS